MEFGGQHQTAAALLPGTHCTRGWLGSRDSLDILEKRQIVVPLLGFEALTVKPTAQSLQYIIPANPGNLSRQAKGGGHQFSAGTMWIFLVRRELICHLYGAAKWSKSSVLMCSKQTKKFEFSRQKLIHNSPRPPTNVKRSIKAVLNNSSFPLTW